MPALRGNIREYLDTNKTQMENGWWSNLKTFFMNRRKFFYALGYGASLTTAARLVATEPSVNPSPVWNRFAAAARDFLEIVNNKPAGSISAAEYRAWDICKREWRNVERTFNQVYRGS